MENNIRDNEQEECQNGLMLPPIVDIFQEPSAKFFQVMDNFSEKWDDASSARFKDEVVQHARTVSIDFIRSVLNMANSYEQLLQAAQSLLSTTAGSGGWLSFNDIGMLAERQVSRWLFNCDDYRW
jgi:hypothetical protein